MTRQRRDRTGWVFDITGPVVDSENVRTGRVRCFKTSIDPSMLRPFGTDIDGEKPSQHVEGACSLDHRWEPLFLWSMPSSR